MHVLAHAKRKRVRHSLIVPRAWVATAVMCVADHMRITKYAGEGAGPRVRLQRLGLLVSKTEVKAATSLNPVGTYIGQRSLILTDKRQYPGVINTVLSLNQYS